MVSEATPTTTKKERVPGQTFLPLARVKRIIKEDPDVTLVNAEATHCIASATELFMEYLVNEGYSRAQKNKRKTIFYKDLASAVNQTDAFEFLEDVIPQTVTLEEAYKRRQQADEGINGSSGKSDTNLAKKRKLQGKLNAQQSSEQQQKESENQEQDDNDNDDGDDEDAEEDEEEVDEEEEEDLQDMEEEEEHEEEEEEEEE